MALPPAGLRLMLCNQLQHHANVTMHTIFSDSIQSKHPLKNGKRPTPTPNRTHSNTTTPGRSTLINLGVLRLGGGRRLGLLETLLHPQRGPKTAVNRRGITVAQIAKRMETVQRTPSLRRISKLGPIIRLLNKPTWPPTTQG